jgi:uridine nucleosidase
VLPFFGRPDVVVYPGAAKPFCRKRVEAKDIHGESGLDGTTLLPEIKNVEEPGKNWMLAMREAIMGQEKRTAWIVATGALTNIALLFAVFPEVGAHIAGLSVMGGSVGGGFTGANLGWLRKEEKSLGERIGNVTPWAEFNIYCDPEAAKAVFRNEEIAEKMTLVPLDLTHLVLATEPVLEGLLHMDGEEEVSRLRLALHHLLTFFAHTYADKFGLVEGPPLHDPLAVAVLISNLNEEYQGGEALGFEDGDSERFHVEVVLEGEQVGRTVVKKVERGEKGVRIPRGVDVKRFWKILEACVERAENIGRGLDR